MHKIPSLPTSLPFNLNTNSPSMASIQLLTFAKGAMTHWHDHERVHYHTAISSTEGFVYEKQLSNVFTIVTSDACGRQQSFTGGSRKPTPRDGHVSLSHEAGSSREMAGLIIFSVFHIWL